MAIVSSLLGGFRFRSTRSLEKAHPRKMVEPRVTNDAFGRLSTGNGNNFGAYNLDQEAYAIPMYDDSHATLNHDLQFSQYPDEQFNQQSVRPRNNQFNFNDDDLTRN